MPDGKVVVIERERVSLVTGAVPTIFPNLPSYLTKIKRKRKSPVKRMPLPKKAKRDVDNTQTKVIVSVDETTSHFTFNNLLKDLSQVSKPHKLWAVSSHEDFIVCVKWKLNLTPEFKCQPERQIIVDANMDVKVSLEINYFE